jgi:hypothetical protein
MSAIRFRQIARLEKLAQPYLEWKSGIERECQYTLHGTAAHAAVLAFLIRYGNPQIDEPLSCATERCAESAAWKECCHATAGKDAFLDRGADRVHCVVDLFLAFLHLNFSRAADADHRYAAGELASYSCSFSRS